MNPVVSQCLEELMRAVEQLANALAADAGVAAAEPESWAVPAPPAAPAPSPAAEKYARLRDAIAQRKDS